MNNRFYFYIVLSFLLGLASVLGKNSDFAVFYNAVKSFLDNGFLSIYQPESLTPFKYHPFSVFFFIPFSLFGFTAGKILWGIFNGFVILHTLYLLNKKYEIKNSSVLVAFLILAHALTWQLKFSNVTFVMMWLLAVLALSNNFSAKVLSITVLILLKPFWVLLLGLYFIVKDYRLILYSLGLLFVCSLLPYLFEQNIFNLWQSTLSHPIHAHNYPKTDNQSFYSLLYRYKDFIAPYFSYLWILGSAFLFATWYYLRFGFSLPFIKRSLEPMDFFSLVIVILWIGPLSWFHSYLLLLPLVILLFQKNIKYKKTYWISLWVIGTGISLLPVIVKKPLYMWGVPILLLLIILPFCKSDERHI